MILKGNNGSVSFLCNETVAQVTTQVEVTMRIASLLAIFIALFGADCSGQSVSEPQKSQDVNNGSVSSTGSPTAAARAKKAADDRKSSSENGGKEDCSLTSEHCILENINGPSNSNFVTPPRGTTSPKVNRGDETNASEGDFSGLSRQPPSSAYHGISETDPCPPPTMLGTVRDTDRTGGTPDNTTASKLPGTDPPPPGVSKPCPVSNKPPCKDKDAGQKETIPGTDPPCENPEKPPCKSTRGVRGEEIPSTDPRCKDKARPHEL